MRKWQLYSSLEAKGGNSLLSLCRVEEGIYTWVHTSTIHLIFVSKRFLTLTHNLTHITYLINMSYEIDINTTYFNSFNKHVMFGRNITKSHNLTHITYITHFNLFKKYYKIKMIIIFLYFVNTKIIIILYKLYFILKQIKIVVDNLKVLILTKWNSIQIDNPQF